MSNKNLRFYLTKKQLDDLLKMHVKLREQSGRVYTVIHNELVKFDRLNEDMDGLFDNIVESIYSNKNIMEKK